MRGSLIRQGTSAPQPRTSGLARLSMALMDIRDQQSGSSVIADVLWNRLLVLEGHEERIGMALATVAAHPELTSLYGILNCVIELAMNDTSTVGCRTAMQRARSAVNDMTLRAVQRAAETVESLGLTTMCVLSHSGTVNRVFERLGKQNIRGRVLCAESRPLLEGRKTAETIAAMGHSVVLCTDAQIAGMVTNDCVIVLGCDRIGNDRFRNKVGSYPLVLCAHHRGASTVLVSGSDKLSDPRIPWLPPRLESASELWDEGPRNITIDNRYFEDVPLSLVDTAIIGDQRMLDQSSFASMTPRFHEKTVAIISALLSNKEPDIDAGVRRFLSEETIP